MASSIIIPALLIAAIGMILGIILTIASKLMAVPVDERVEAVGEALPGANCGGCGYAGCADYASAVVADPSIGCGLCPVGGASVAEAIASILGMDAGEAEPTTAIVACQGNFGVTQNIADIPVKTCKEAVQVFGGNRACRFGCLGLGDCVTSCNFDAIKVIGGVAVVNRDECKSCGKCVSACPKHLISIVKQKEYVQVQCCSHDKAAAAMKACKNACIGCGKCAKACKFEAIAVEDGLAKIDYEKCKNCGLCAKQCPTGAIANYRPKPVKKAAPKAEEA